MKNKSVHSDWIEAILIVANHYRLEYSEEHINISDSWLKNETLSDALRIIARQAGLTVKVIKPNKKDINAWRLPLVVQFKQGQLAVINTINSENLVGISYCGDKGAQSSITLEELLKNINLAVILRPVRNVPDSRIDDYIQPYQHSWFKKLVIRDWKPYTHIFIASFIVNILALAGILFTRQVYDRVIPAESYSTLYVLFSGVIITIAFGYILRSLRYRITDLLGKRADLRISDRIFGHTLRIKNSKKPRSTGTLISQVKELDSVRELLTSTTVLAFADMPFFIVFCIVFWLLAGPLVWVPIAAVLLMIIPGLLAQKKLRAFANQNIREVSLRNAMLVESIQGSEDIKILQAEQRFQQQWNHYNTVSADINLKLRTLTNALSNWTQTIQTGAFVLIVLFGTPLVIDGNLTTGSLIAASILGGRMIAPMAGLTQVLNRWQQAKAALTGLNQLLALPVDSALGEKKVHRNVISGKYDIQDAAFFYSEDDPLPALHIKSLKIKPGEKIAILGKNGAGKSTLLQALSGLLSPSTGTVTVDDINIEHIDPNDLRRDIGLMSQNSKLFHGSIRENLMLGAPLATDEELVQALRITGALEFIQKSPKGLDHIVAEGGLGLSGGQKQSLLLSRLLLRKPHILLLDEPTTALDEVTEFQFIQNLQKSSNNKTIIISTHKTSILNIVDRIIVIANGKIILDEPKATALAQLSKRSQEQQG